jgi:hypothetical protein
MNINQLKPEQHATLLTHVKALTHYTERLLNRLYQRDFRKHNEFVQKTVQVQRALRELEHYIHCNPPANKSDSELPF